MNCLEAENDGHGPVHMEVGAMKGKKGDKGKKGYGKGKYDENNEYNKNNEYGKGSEKGREKGKKSKGKGQVKNEKPAPNSSFQGYLQVMWQVEAQDERVLARLRASRGGSAEFFREFSGAECSDHTCGCEDSSVYSRDQRKE